jgi:hypothetical protein
MEDSKNLGSSTDSRAENSTTSNDLKKKAK